MDIDLVYMWVNGDDPEWKKKKNIYLPEAYRQSPDLTGKCRYVQTDELRYSLRSAEMYAPWIRRIFVVTDSQVPDWLDTGNPKIRIVDHSEIIDKEFLPLFSSTAIELNIYKIPGLSEHFLFSNDDMFFARRVDPSFFFTGDGLPVMRFKNKDIVTGFSHYQTLLKKMSDETVRRSGFLWTKAPHHNIDAYLKSEWASCIEYYRDWFVRTMRHRFRHADDMHRHLITLWTLQRQKAVPKIVGKRDGVRWKKFPCLSVRRMIDSRYMSMRSFSFRYNMWHFNPALFTINDNYKVRPWHRRRMARFLATCFPEKSMFEKTAYKI